MLRPVPTVAERDCAELAEALRGRLARLAERICVRPLGYADANDPGARTAEDETIPVSFTPGEIFVGPVYPGSDGPCMQCFALRWQKLRSPECRAVLDAGRATVSAGPSPYLTGFLVATVAALCERVADEPGADRGHVYAVDCATLEVRRYEALADPYCERCSRHASPGTVGLRHTPKPTPEADRLADAKTLLRHRDALVNPVAGMVGRRVTPEHAHTTTVPATGHFQARGAWGLFPVHWSGHADSEADSVALALCEAMERYAGLGCAGVEVEVRDAYTNVADRAIDPERCGVNATDAAATRLVGRYDRDLPIDWVKGHDLTADRSVLVPKQLVYYGESDDEQAFVKETSNGCASGSCIEEAILHGILELVERDAFLLAWYGAARLPELDPDSCTSGATRLLLERVRMLGYDVRAFDGRIDLHIPVVVVAARNRDTDRLGALTISAAAHFDPERALAAALREVASCVAHLAERTGSDLERVRAMTDDYAKVTELADHALLFGLPEMARHADFLFADGPVRSLTDAFADWKRPRHSDLADDVRFCRDRLADAGFEVVVVDQTTPEGRRVGLHTVCVVVPGLIPIDFGWSHQRALGMPRMLDAFRAAGWRPTPLDPSELHRVPHPYM